jgi:hypothetical protein
VGCFSLLWHDSCSTVPCDHHLIHVVKTERGEIVRVLLPTVEHRGQGYKLAKRPDTLDNKVIGFLDGWGQRQEDGSYAMYPLMQEILAEMKRKYQIAGHVWKKKTNVSHPVEDPELADFLSKVDVVVNGECA